MSEGGFGGFGSREGGDWPGKLDKLAAEADADRLARVAGYKSPLRRLLERVRPHRQEQGDDPAERLRHHR